MDNKDEVRRGWLVPSDGSTPFEIPTHHVGDIVIRWKPGDDAKLEPGESITYLASKDHYQPHPFEDEPNVLVYVRDGLDPKLPDAIRDEIRRQLKDS